MSNPTFSEKISSLVDEVGMAMFTTMTAEGKHVSRPLAVQQAEDNADLWFFTYENSDKVRQIANEPAVNISFTNGKSGPWVSLAGQAQVVHDSQKIDELWSPLLNAWFPDGKDTEGLCLIRVEAESAEYWETANSRVATALSLVKSAVTGKTAGGDIGNNESGTL